MRMLPGPRCMLVTDIRIGRHGTEMALCTERLNDCNWNRIVA
jgi:hypothetical protein